MPHTRTHTQKNVNVIYMNNYKAYKRSKKLKRACLAIQFQDYKSKNVKDISSSSVLYFCNCM